MTSADFHRIFAACNLTQKDFAARLGVKQPMISLWLNGRDVPARYDTKLRILAATAAGVSREQQREAAQIELHELNGTRIGIELVNAYLNKTHREDYAELAAQLKGVANDLSGQIVSAQERLAELEKVKP